MASVKRGKKLIGRLKIGNRFLKDPRGIKKEIIKFFKCLYTAEERLCLKHSGRGFSCLTQEQRDGLEIMPSREEIKRAVWSCESTKAPGYDGFNLGFVKRLWQTVGDDFAIMVLEFFENGTLPKAINTTWVG